MHTLCEQRRRANEQSEQNDNKLRLVTWRFPGVFELSATEISATEHEEFGNGKYLFRTDELRPLVR